MSLNRYVVFGDDGLASYVGESVELPDAEYTLIPAGVDVEEVLGRWYLVDGNVQVREPRPSIFHYWSSSDAAWVENLDEARRHCLSSVDSAAESARMQHLTPGSGQSMTYEAKHQEALAGGGPMISAEADALDMTVQEVVDSVLVARQEWQVLGAQIEAARLKAKKQIRVAATAAEMHRIASELQHQLTQ